MNQAMVIATVLSTIFLACSGEATVSNFGSPAGGLIVLRADRILDGTGQMWTDQEIVVRDGRIDNITEVGQTVAGTVCRRVGVCGGSQVSSYSASFSLAIYMWRGQAAGYGSYRGCNSGPSFLYVIIII